MISKTLFFEMTKFHRNDDFLEKEVSCSFLCVKQYRENVEGMNKMENFALLVEKSVSALMMTIKGWRNCFWLAQFALVLAGCRRSQSTSCYKSKIERLVYLSHELRLFSKYSLRQIVEEGKRFPWQPKYLPLQIFANSALISTYSLLVFIQAPLTA